MNDGRRREEVEARRFDWALREVVGDERAPDVTAAVLARAAAGDSGERAEAIPALSRRRWLALAALFLLGVFTVLGVALARRGPGEGVTVDEAQGRQVTVVTRAEAIPALPPDLQAVELRDLGDAAVAALVLRCPELEHLCVFASTATSRPGTVPDGAVSITDAALPAIGSLWRLRRLELVGVGHVKGTGLGELARLPYLESLTLSMFDLDDDSLQVLPRLQSLRELDLMANQGYGERGLATIGACKGLRRLSLSGSAPLRDEWFQSLASLTSLQSLDLFGTGLTRRLLFARGFPEPRSPRFGERSLGVAALQRWPALRTLSLANALHLEPSVGAALVRLCPGLQSVVLDVCLEIDDTTVADLLALRFLRSLSLRDCKKVTATSVPLLAAAHQLREVHFGKAPWLTMAHAERLLRSGKDVTCARPEDPAFEADLARLRASFETALAVPRVQVLRSLAEIDALPDDLTHVDLRGLGDGAAVRLASHRQLRHVGVVRDDDEPFTKAGLQALARLPLLEELELNNLPNLEADALTALRAGKALRSLDIVGVRVDDAAMQVLPDLPGLTALTLTGVKTLGDVGLQAIARCRGLQRLGLPNCGVREAAALARVGDLQQLVELDLRDNPGLLDRAVMSLQNCRSLRRLVLAGGQFSSMALQAVTGLRQLEALDLGGNDQLVTSALQLLPVGLQELGLANCQGFGADAATLLRDRFPGLRSLDLADNAWVTDAALAAIVANPSLQQLQLNGCQQLTNASFATIRAARSLRSVHVVRTAVMSQEQQRQLAAERPELQVVRQVW